MRGITEVLLPEITSMVGSISPKTYTAYKSFSIMQITILK